VRRLAALVFLVAFGVWAVLIWEALQHPGAASPRHHPCPNAEGRGLLSAPLTSPWPLRSGPDYRPNRTDHRRNPRGRFHRRAG
jgi:hypothetical protein